MNPVNEVLTASLLVIAFHPDGRRCTDDPTRGLVGTSNLNKVLQQLINPPGEEKAEKALGDSILRVGARVMQLKNDYNKEVFNGDLGIVKAITFSNFSKKIDSVGN